MNSSKSPVAEAHSSFPHSSAFHFLSFWFGCFLCPFFSSHVESLSLSIHPLLVDEYYTDQTILRVIYHRNWIVLLMMCSIGPHNCNISTNRCQNIYFKIMLLTYKSLYGLGPKDITYMLPLHRPFRPHRSSGTNLLIIPRANTKHGKAGFNMQKIAGINSLRIYDLPQLWPPLKQDWRLLFLF